MEEPLDLLDGLDLDLDLEGGGLSNGGGQQAAGEFFGPYHLIQQVGSGGVAKVWRARHIHPGYADKTFAIKILHDELSRDPKVVELFRHEAYVLSLLKHPNIVETFEAGSQDQKLFIAMEYIDGRDLDNMVIRCQRARLPIPIPLVLHIVSEALKALTYAHRLRDADDNGLQLVHRDINPANVFLSFDGRVKLGDFGVASITMGALAKDHRLAGKAGYFAPEQLEGGAVDHRADLFAVSIMLFEMLCGVRLFQGDDTDTVIRHNKRAKIPKPSRINPQIQPGLEQVLLRGLERRPDDRFANGDEMLAALQPFHPGSASMPLAVAAMLRKAFLNEHIQELQLREGLAGQSQTRGSGQVVALLTHEQRARAAFTELLTSRGYRVDAHSDVAELGKSIEQLPSCLLVDVTTPGFDAAAHRDGLGRYSQPVPVVAFADVLEPNLIRNADAVGACDFIFKPYNIERVLTAIRSAVTGATRVATIDPITAAVAPRVHRKVLIMSRDPALISRLSAGLVKRGFDVETSPSITEAVERTKHSSPDAVIYDAQPANPADRYFPAQFRAQPGMGLVPILFLTDPESLGLFAGVDADRSAVRPRKEPPAVIIQTLSRLRGDTRQGRSFLRFEASFPVEMRYAGRVFSGQALDVSRGGVMFSCVDQMPPVGTVVGLNLRLPGTTSPVQVTCRVARVELPGGEHADSRVGVEFDSFSQTGETQLIAHLATLDQTSRNRGPTTMIMNSTPDGR